MTNISLNNEIFRKIVHLFILVLPIGFCFLGRANFMVIILAATAIIAGMDYFRRENILINNFFVKIFAPILRSHELDGQKLCGASWMLFAASLVFLICKKEIAVSAFAILAISDALAALIGRSFISKEFFEKSFAGSCAFYFSGMIILFICGAIFNVNLWFYIFGLFSLFCAMVLEARPSLLNIDDNFTIPVSFATLMTIFDLMWDIIPGSYF